MKRIEDIEALLVQCEADLAQLKNLCKLIEKTEVNRKKLDEYYHHQYPQDYEHFSNSHQHYRALNQDSIWNVLEEQYAEKIQIIKAVIQSL